MAQERNDRQPCQGKLELPQLFHAPTVGIGAQPVNAAT
jgi:hypothetical protein